MLFARSSGAAKTMRIFRGPFVATLGSIVAIFLSAADAQAQQPVQRITLKSGETVELRNFFYIVNCQSIMIGSPQLDVLEGPDEVSVSLNEHTLLPRTQNCAKPVPGGSVVATAKEVTDRKDVKLTIRLKFNTKVGQRQDSSSYLVSLFPGTTHEPVPAAPPTKAPDPAAPTQAQQDPRKVALKSGESVVLRNFFFVSNCESVLTAPTTIDVLEGADEVSLSVRDEMVVPRTRNCPNSVPGGVVVATAKTIDHPKEVKVTYRLNFTTKMGARQSSNSYIVSLFPSDAVSVPAPPVNSASPSQSASPQ
jgi:hypothetical protein